MSKGNRAGNILFSNAEATKHAKGVVPTPMPMLPQWTVGVTVLTAAPLCDAKGQFHPARPTPLLE